MALWLFSFVLGSLLGSLNDIFFRLPTYKIGIFCFLFALILKPKNRIHLGLVLVSGLCWGAAHQAPVASEALETVKLIQNDPFTMSGHVIIKHKDRYYSAKGKGLVGDVGSVSIEVPKNSFLKTQEAFYRSHPYLNNETSITSWVEKLRELSYTKILSLPVDTRGLYASVLIGDMTDLHNSTKKAFVVLGLFHLLVVSGSHVSLLSAFLKTGLALPFRLVYMLGFLAPIEWLYVNIFTRLFTMVLLFLFVLIIGFPQSAQRALLIFFCVESAFLLGKKPSHSQILLSGLGWQAAIFPLGFFTLSSLMSWSAYLVILNLSKFPTWWERFTALLRTQIILTLLVAGFTAQLSLIGIIANFIVVPLFPIIFFAAIIQLFHENLPSEFLTISTEIGLYFIDLAQRFQQIHKSYPYLFIDLFNFTPWVRWGCLYLGCHFFLNACKNVSINRK